MLRGKCSNTQVLEESHSQIVKEESKTEIVLKSLKLKPHKKVTFTEDTVDNEHMGKRKSKS